ncbi:MAG: hypothetical protein ABIE25_04950 [Thermoplasmatota archaeon]|nr:hypothetical protein [Candidatus Thermoplasmatota archaeon]MBU1915292.1 hypothetical protein [Candidatus Thermoplasmatota archaeon]
MDSSQLDILREALEIQQRKETFEQALGRAVRRHDLDFSVYVQMVAEIRDLALSNSVPLETAARRLLAVGE